jgi:hypothetical protein
MSNRFNAKTLPLLAFTALAITASFATSASASCQSIAEDFTAVNCLVNDDKQAGLPMGEIINQNVNTLTSTAQTMGYTGPANTSGSAQGASLPVGLGGASASSEGYVDTNGNPVIITPRPQDGVQNADGSQIVPVDRTYVNPAGKIETYTVYVTVPGSGSGAGSNGGINQQLLNALSRGPLGIGGGDGSAGAGGSVVQNAIHSIADAAAAGEEKKATSRGSTSAPITAPNVLATVTKATLKGAVGTLVALNAARNAPAHATPTAPKMVSMVATQKSGPITPPVNTPPKVAVPVYVAPTALPASSLHAK